MRHINGGPRRGTPRHCDGPVLGRAITGTAVLSTVLLLTACGTTGGESGSAQAREQALIIAENEPPATFDPLQANNSTVDEVARPAYDTLVRFEGGELVPSVALDWSVSEDGTTVEMTLRDDVVFHDGSTLTAADVVYTLDRVDRLQIGVSALLAGYESAEAVDDTHVAITLSEPRAPFLSALSRLYLLNADLVEENAGDDDGQQWLSANDAGSGPYRLTGYTPNQEAVFEVFEDYWGGIDGQAQSVVFRYLSEASTQATALRQGEVDIAMDISPQDWEAMGNEGFTIDRADTNVQLYALFDMTGKGETEQAALREAIAYSYDYEQHVESILKGAGTAAQGVLPTGMPCHSADVLQPTYDPDRAREILDEEGIGDVSLTMTYLEATAEMEQAATLLQSNLADVGIDLELQAITYPQYVEITADPESIPDLGMIYTFPAFPDPDAVLYQSFHSANIGGGMNFGGYSDAEVDELVELGQRSTDEQERCAAYAEAQEIVAEDHAALALSNPQYVTVIGEGVTGYAYDPAHHQTVDVYRITKG
ncbi:ABC transporter substrate-binding protein [Nocardiopsis sp. CNT312]|uniref:ABC transporter substrate-binding protein n=1 Tax=Nocardiopsis sp. CNT312 TaxID=1137268 RepID=UPI0004B36E1B|nr:ABC transporter substrate-binding protein [Nocardiopsis sp. CNT312]